MKQKPAESEPTIKAAIYCRVSTYNQSQGDYSSLKTQEDLLSSYCRTKGWDIYDVYVDTRTGTTLEREELNRLLRDARDGKFNIVLATKLDRLSRSMKDFFEINETLAESNVDVVLATQNIDTTSSMGRFNRNVLMAFAEFERDMIAERTLEKLYSQAQKGYWGGGHAPLGYSVKDKKLIIEPTEAELVKRIFRDYIGMPSTTKVATHLNEDGFRTKSHVTKSGKQTGAARFTKQSVRDTLRNKIYLGIIKFKGEEFKGIHDPIIDESTFGRVQSIMAESAKNPRATSITESPLTLLGITQCGHCESLLSSSSTFKKEQNRRYYYYKCSKAAHHTKEHCPAKDLPAAELEELVLSVAKGLVIDESFLDAVIRQMEGNSAIDTKQMDDDLRSLKTNLAKATNELENLIRLAASSSGNGQSEVLGKMIQERENDRASIKTRISKLEREREKVNAGKVDKQTIKNLMSEYSNLYHRFEKEQKKQLNQILFSAIISFLKRGTKEGEIELRIRGNGAIRKRWDDIKKGIPVVRTPGSLGSAGKTRTCNPPVNSRMLHH